MLALLSWLALPALLAADGSQDRTHKRVVVVHMSNFLMPASMLAGAAMRDALLAQARTPIEFEPESLDVLDSMNLAPEQEALERERLRNKYRSRQADLVVAIGGLALEFVQRNRAAIWQNIPVVYYGVSDRRLTGETLPNDVGGLSVHYDAEGTLALATQLQPRAREVVYVAGVSPYDVVFEPIVEDALRRHGDRLSLRKLIGMPLPALQRELARLPADSIVFYSSMFLDSAGASHVPADVARALAESSAAPLYSFFGAYLGAGIVGGSTIDFEEHARHAGLLAARVLNENASTLGASLPQISDPSRCSVDMQQLERWNMSDRLVPARCTVLFNPSSTSGHDRELWLLVAVALVLLTAMGLALRNQTDRRGAAEREVIKQREEVVHAARLALVGEISASIVHEVTQPLSAILSNADAAEMLLERSNPSLEQVREILADIRRDDARAHQIVSRLRMLLKKGELHVDSVDVNELTASAVALIEPEARRRNVVLSSHVEAGLPAVTGDRVHLQQVLLNLLVNALDAMDGVPATERLLEVRTSQHGPDAVCVSVRDSGQGIAVDSLPQLFDSFFTTKRGGMGLGLSIAKAIVDAHGGNLQAIAATARGAEFRFTIPTRRASAQHSN